MSERPNQGPRLPMQRPVHPPAPFLTSDGRCSDCNVKGRPAGERDLIVCPRCYALLWHADWSAEMRQKRAEAAAIAEVERAEIKRRRHEAFQARETERHKIFPVPDFTTSGPVLGTPTLKENKDNDR
jgi:hypothetical protein